MVTRTSNINRERERESYDYLIIAGSSFVLAKAMMNMQKQGFLLEVEHASDGSKSRV